jgi:hypothetical protein
MAIPSATSTVYGHRHLAFWFVPVLATDSAGFTFDGRRYAWTDVQSVDEWDLRKLNAGVAQFRARIILSDGTRIHLNGRALEKAGVKPRIGFFTTRSDAYDELLAMFRQRAI